MPEDIIIIAHLLDVLGCEVDVDINLTVNDYEVRNAIRNLEVYTANTNISDDSDDITRVLTKYNITTKQAMKGLVNFAKSRRIQLRVKG